MLLPSFLNTRSTTDTTTATHAPSALVVSVRMRRRVMGFLTAAGMAAVVVLGAAVPASAAVNDVFTVDNIEYTVTSEDDATVKVTGHTAPVSTFDIPDSVENGTTYTVTSIGSNVFSHTSYLTSVTIPDSVTSIGDAAFTWNNLFESVTIPNSVTSIGDYAFYSNALTTVTIPNSVTDIPSGAFGYNSLTSVTIPDSVTTIGNFAFEGNSLTSVTIPNSVTSIGGGAFAYNPSLESVTFAGSAPSDNGPLFVGDETAVKVYYYAKYHKDVVANGFENPWYGYTTSALPVTELAVSLDLDLNVGDPVADAPVEIAVEGLLVGSAYTVVVRSTPTTITSGSATNTGTVSDSSGLMPSGLAPGAHTVTFTGTDADGNAVSRVAYLTVSDTGTVTYLSYTASESPTLAETGFEVAPFGAAALLLLAAGVVLMVRRRRVTA
jgi:hypothetical protein